jgi:hypothetical protein
MSWKNSVVFFVGAALVAGALVLANRESAQGQAGKGSMGSGPAYSVVASDGAHLIVTDNGSSKLYFYAIDKEGKVGDDLKLRGSVDLHDVGKPALKPINAMPQK